ncbi:MAG: VOC family protein [Microvirga sp.]
MLSHVTIGVGDMERALAFYQPLMQALGHVPKFSEPRWAGWRQPGQARPLFIIGHPYDGEAALPGNGQMVAFLAADRAGVRACHALALRHGGRDEGPPGPRPEYHPHYYGAYMRDPDGNKLCVCCHEPEPDPT